MFQVHRPVLAPSLLSADFTRLGEEISTLEQNGIEWLHWDIMDGHFVPNITIGSWVVAQFRKQSKCIFDCHLMVENPDFWVPEFHRAGADLITVHLEATTDLPATIRLIKKLGCKVGVSIKPKTKLELLHPYLNDLDLVLLMSVEPGFGGQKLIPEVLEKARELVRLRNEKAYPFWIQMDGGIHEGNIAEVQKTGIDVFVAGSAVFKNPNRSVSITLLKQNLGS